MVGLGGASRAFSVARGLASKAKAAFKKAGRRHVNTTKTAASIKGSDQKAK